MIDHQACPDPFDRMAALDALAAEAGEAQAQQAAAALLADPDPGVREHAARQLLAFGTEEAARLIVPYVWGRDITVRNLAGEVLAQMGWPAIQALEPVVDSPDKDARKFAIDVLALLPAHSCGDRIAARLEDEDGNVRLAAVDALMVLGGPEHVPALRALYDREPLARANVVAALGAVDGANHLDVLEAALIDEDPVVQLAAAEALARQTSPEVLGLLLRKVDDVDAMARPVVLNSLVALLEASPEAALSLPASLRDHLVEMLNDTDAEYRCAAARGLGFFLDSVSVAAMLSVAGEEDKLDVTIFGILLGYPDRLTAILEAADAGRMSEEAAANFILGLLAQQAIHRSELARAGGYLEKHFQALDADTRIAAVSLAQHLSVLHGIVRAGLDDPDPVVHTFAQDIAEAAGLTHAGDAPDGDPFLTLE